MNEESWHLDKRVPVSLIFTLMFQLFAGIWFAAKIDGRVTTIESSMSSLFVDQAALRDQTFTQAVALGRIEERVKSVDNNIIELKRFLEQATQK